MIDRAHRLHRPSHLPTTTARDVIGRIHFYHMKERIMKACRNATLPDLYCNIKFFADLSASALQFRKSMSLITTTLRPNGISYRWGYPANLLIQKDGDIHAMATENGGQQKFQDWGMPLPGPLASTMAKVPRLTPELSQA
ncbi:Hypothetical predicted protein [Pelobates cultripes]|uniref:Uncharacterized protein n=1 Tax=Pelobates cultripes TaxID=61616 RepID=A0AAD1WME4_PELCU|nr:Hypothetical predicted protein [Pelobates cultripes]